MDLKLFKKAFTLSETLITLVLLGIIGVIITSIINNIQNTIHMTKLKKYYAYYTNRILETMASVGCYNIACVMEQYNVYNHYSADELARINVLFPDLTKDEDGKCVPKEFYYLSGEKVDSVSEDDRRFAMNSSNGGNYEAYCTKDKSGILINTIGFSAWYKYGTNKDICAENSINHQQCANIIIFLDKSNKKAVLGKNAFLLKINASGEQVTQTKSYDTCDKNQTKSGTSCIENVMKNNWKINY